ncbi:uncharacterized protein LOC130687787 [Daphnia carinata]|uniref:uncharacterized protein LOC130687787 n=1 Tax=Daphnia carinata TaxID=120202 RepID=UPI00257B0A5F|nr:uncharacterized protein LOC130687787 [Daphnia carinata]
MYLNTISTELPTISRLLPIFWPYSLSSHRTAENKAFFVFATPVISSSLRPSSCLRFGRRPVFASPVIPSFASPVIPSFASPVIPSFASPVIPSLLRPSSRLCIAGRPVCARRPVFASPVVPSLHRPSSRLCIARRPVSTSPIAPSSPPLRHLVFVVWLFVLCCIMSCKLTRWLPPTHFGPLFFVA